MALAEGLRRGEGANLANRRADPHVMNLCQRRRHQRGLVAFFDQFARLGVSLTQVGCPHLAGALHGTCSPQAVIECAIIEQNARERKGECNSLAPGASLSSRQ